MDGWMDVEESNDQFLHEIHDGEESPVDSFSFDSTILLLRAIPFTPFPCFRESHFLSFPPGLLSFRWSLALDPLR
jgi:hypothetical protein